MDNDMKELEIPRQEQPPITPKYVSKKGFVTIPVLRGFSEIENLYNDLDRFDVFICGGYVRYMCSTHQNPTQAGDVDIYCQSPEEFEKLKTFMITTKEMNIRHENNVSITFTRKSLDHPYFACGTIQLIKPIKQGKIVAFGSMQEILENFDFTVIRCGLISQYSAMVDADFEHDEQNKILRLKNIHCPIS
ncbi:MAG: hypothetical protein ACFFDN_50905, partial [Candidatus Hodarchaeota archaeon]